MGWVFQYYNDHDRKQLDEKVAKRGKIAPDEVASKTQLFTERYMCEWLLANSVGGVWRDRCRENNWPVASHELWVSRPEESPPVVDELKELRVLDPAVGTGNMLLVAFDYLMTLYEEEATVRQRVWDPVACATQIVEHNLCGVDLDEDAVALAKVLLLWKAWSYGARPRRVQVVAPMGAPNLTPIQEWVATWGVQE